MLPINFVRKVIELYQVAISMCKILLAVKTLKELTSPLVSGQSQNNLLALPLLSLAKLPALHLLTKLVVSLPL